MEVFTMGKSNTKKQETVVDNTVNTESKAPENQVAEEPKEKLGTKVGNFVKKHGKKIAAGAVVAGGAIIGYALGLKNGKTSANDDGDDDYGYYGDEPEAVDYVAEN